MLFSNDVLIRILILVLGLCGFVVARHIFKHKNNNRNPLIFVPKILPSVFVNFMITLSMIAFVFSLYLIVVQIFILKKGCSWCFISALISILIFILTILI